MKSTFTTPPWVHHAVFYRVFPDRFAASASVAKPGALEPWDALPTIHGFKGGDLAGIAENLDYLAVLFQATYPGAPCIYYGDEIGMIGGDDPACAGFPWDRGRWDTGLRSWYQRCIRLRRDHPALRDGSWEVLHAEDGVVVYARALGDDGVIVALNASSSPRTVHVAAPAGVRDGQRLVDAMGGRGAVTAGGRLEGLALAPRSGTALVRG